MLSTGARRGSFKNRLAFLRAASAGVAAMVAATSMVLAPSAHAGDVTWDNGASNFIWDTSSVNWTGAAWINASGDGAIFGATGVGAISLPGPINVNSLNFTASGYSVNGAGPLTFVNGTSTQTTGVVNVATGATTQINVPINSAVAFQKIGAGVLELSAPSSFGGSIPLTTNGLLRGDLLVGGITSPIASGTVRLMNNSVVPATTRVAIGNGYLDIGSNNVTLGELTFTNVTPTGPWNTTLNANNGVIGSGTLRVTEEINVIGITGGGFSNTIASKVDLGGGTQVVRCGVQSFILANTSLMFTGSLSNGSLLKTIGVTRGGSQGSIDGISLFGNNTYTGATIINSGSNIATGTNASTSIKVAGIPAGPAVGFFSLQGQNGSFLSAPLIQAVAGGEFRIDNNAAVGATGNNAPNVPSFQNNNRIRDDAEIQLRDGVLTYRGRTTEAASETFGNLNVIAGHNIVNITPNGAGGTATVTASGNLMLGQPGNASSRRIDARRRRQGLCQRNSANRRRHRHPAADGRIGRLPHIQRRYRVDSLHRLRD